MHRFYKTMLSAWAAVLWLAAPVYAGARSDEAHVKVAMRMIGHELLLRSGDSVSRVLPVEREGGRYRLRFASAFAFDPGELAALVDSIVRQTRAAGSYRVEVEACAGREVVYSYEVTDTARADSAPCRNRVQPEGCYELLFTILEAGAQADVTAFLPAQMQAGFPDDSPGAGAARGAQRIGYAAVVLPVAAVLGLAGVLAYSRWKKAKPVSLMPGAPAVPDPDPDADPDPDSPHAGFPSSALSAPFPPDPDVLPIGAYRFDKRNMTLSRNHEVIELTGKECDLLLLLHSAVNTTVPREVILHTVWGDEGDYIGRTLDVFISRLRRKLEADPGLKIVNIRGVGYKLIVNG